MPTLTEQIMQRQRRCVEHLHHAHGCSEERQLTDKLLQLVAAVEGQRHYTQQGGVIAVHHGVVDHFADEGCDLCDALAPLQEPR